MNRALGFRRKLWSVGAFVIAVLAFAFYLALRSASQAESLFDWSAHAEEVLDNLDADIEPDDLEDADPFAEGDLGLLSDIGLPEAVLSVILDETDLYADEQLGRIAREMGFADELSSVLDKLNR